MVTEEKRGAQRVQASLSAKVTLPREDGTASSAAIETINISASGVYFKSDHFIEPMTKLALGLELPTSKGADGSAAETSEVECEGLVVRTIPEEESPDADGYEIAVFFTSIDPLAIRTLEDHIALLMDDS